MGAINKTASRVFNASGNAIKNSRDVRVIARLHPSTVSTLISNLSTFTMDPQELVPDSEATVSPNPLDDLDLTGKSAFSTARNSQLHPELGLGLVPEHGYGRDYSGLITNISEVLALYPLICGYEEGELSHPALAVKRRLERILASTLGGTFPTQVCIFLHGWLPTD